MLHIAVCDDEITVLEAISAKIQKVFEHLGQPVAITNYLQGVELRRRIFAGEHYDVLFLDIDMKDIDGIELSRHLRNNRIESLIVFISNREEYVFKSFSVRPFRFLRKIDLEGEIHSIIRDIIQEFNRKDPEFLLLETATACLKVNPYEIVYVECNDKTLRIVTEGKEHLLRYKISDLEAKLQRYGFLRTHKGYLVNYRYVFSIEKNEVILDTKERIPLSKHRIAEVKDQFRRLVI